MNSYPNSDCKQCTESKLGWVHSAHTQSPGRAHTARTVPRLWALLRSQRPCRAHVARTASAGRALSVRRPRAQHAQVARIAPMSWDHVATSLPCPVQPSRSRRHFDVATSRQPESFRDIISVSRHRLFCQPQARSPPYVATSISCRDLLDNQPLSRRHFHVATSSSCRDLPD